jgi:flagellar hook assembly protein FlgD
VALRIYSATGRLVRAIENDRQPAGYYLLAWDGRDDMHRVMGHGVYYCLLDAGATAAPATKFRAVRKLIKLD